ncbi:hypothetical protein [Pantoea sp. SO10]|uniref:hypothetical protein n=1 Tax=Pantoea sp. SO10 TaxID=2575375 RepID=UPI0010C9CD87|nr:hypothetical protein [Pantoea sp. SO10]QCP59345.1 hypothetical protein FCN45_08150 [Pantoea sp. SO10]
MLIVKFIINNHIMFLKTLSLILGIFLSVIRPSNAEEFQVKEILFTKLPKDDLSGRLDFSTDNNIFLGKGNVTLSDQDVLRLVNRSRSDLWVIDLPTRCDVTGTLARCTPLISSMEIPDSAFFGDRICMILNPKSGPTSNPAWACTTIESSSRPTLTCDVRQPTLIDLGEVENKGPNQKTVAESTGGHSFDVSCNGVATLRLDIQGAQWMGLSADNCTDQPIAPDGVVITIEGICPNTKLNTDLLNGAMKVRWYLDNPMSGVYQQNVIFNLNYD